MKISHALIALVPVVSAAVAAMVVVERRHEAAELRGLRAAVASLSASVDSSRQRADDRESVGAMLRQIAARPTQQEPVPPTTTPAPEAPQARAPTPAEVRDKLDGVFAGEQVDTKWAQEARAKAEGKLAAAMPATSALRSVECRASMCRVETVHEDLGSYRQFVEKAFQDPETRVWNGGFFSTPVDKRDDGTLVIVAYLAREGEALPPLAQAP
jgi:hypothetical protein